MNQRGDKLPEEMCISLLGSKPLSAERCEVGSGSCQDTCVFSEWTEWSACSQRCNGVRKRWRSMEGTEPEVLCSLLQITFPNKTHFLKLVHLVVTCI